MRFVLLFVLSNILATAAYANEVRLLCVYEYTHNLAESHRSGPTSGEFFLYLSEKNGDLDSMEIMGLICTKGDLIQFDELNIKIRCTNKLHSDEFFQRIEQVLSISRISGRFELLYNITGVAGGLLHTGKCAAERKAF